jgi:hypothetical protein
VTLWHIDKYAQQLKFTPEWYLLLVSEELKTMLSAPYVSDTAGVKAEKQHKEGVKQIR